MNVEQLAKNAIEKIKSNWGLPKRGFIAGGSITNLLNTSFISDATNNQNGSFDNFDANSATVMFGGGFRFNVSLGIQF
jgi:hypothetical protein